MINLSDILNASILIVDDEEHHVLLLERSLHGAGYTSVTFTMNPFEVCDLHLKNCYDLILLDIQMPGMDGFQVMECLNKIVPDGDLPVLVIAADSDHKLRALQAGAKDFVNKPFELVELLTRVHNMLKMSLLHIETKRTSIELEKLNHELQQLVEAQVQEISDAQRATILAMSKLAESRDDDTGKHLERTRQFCKIIAQQLQKQPAYASLINNTFIDNIYHASPLHDIGKVAIPDSILLKPGELTPDEFKIIKKHALLGATTLQSVHDRYPQNIFITMGVEIARSHHEKWDGSGYPDGLIGDAIPLSAQIMALADVYDALRSKRCYREAFTHAQSCEIIIKGSGTHFAPAIVDAYIVLEQEFDAIHSRTGEIMVE